MAGPFNLDMARHRGYTKSRLTDMLLKLILMLSLSGMKCMVDCGWDDGFCYNGKGYSILGNCYACN